MSDSSPSHALNLDLSQQQSFVRFFNNLPEKPPSTVRFFCRGDYYSVHGSDATFLSDYIAKPMQYMGEEPKLSYLCIGKAQFELVLRELLLIKLYRVEVYTKPAQTKSNDWELPYKGSPGNLAQFEELLFSNANLETTNSVMAIKINPDKVTAVAAVNLTDYKIEVCEINDNDCFTELEAIIAQISPKECIIPNTESAEVKQLKDVLERNSILVAKVKKSDFTSDDVTQDLNRLLFFPEGHARCSEAVAETNMDNAMECLQAAIRFLNLTGDEKFFNQFKISKFDPHRFVRLDNAALFALNVIPQERTGSSDETLLRSSAYRDYCLLGILNHCVTPQGKRLLEQWIKQPLKDYNLVNERLEIVEFLVKNPEIRNMLTKDSLTRVMDLMLLARRLSSKNAKLQDCYKVYQTISGLPGLINALRKSSNKYMQAAIINPLIDVVNDLQGYQSMIEETVDLDLVDQDQFFVKSSFNDELRELSQKKHKIEEKLQRELSKAANDLGFDEGKGIKLEYNDQHGYFFRVTLKEEHSLRKNKNYRILDAIKGGVRFTNDKISSLNEEYSVVKSEYEETQKSVVNDILVVAKTYIDTLKSLNYFIATVDVLNCFANASVAARIPYVRPKMHPAGSGVLKLKKARHPCVEQNNRISFIPNDVDFDQADKTFYIITGPNMCGKSTYIRSVGICTLMAHIGCFVPCEAAEISMVDGILARVAASDCQLKGLSTFMMEMIETSTIIKTVTQNSLVIIDELGRGTSTYDGCGIAWAISEHLAQEVKCFALFATHFHEITDLAETTPTVGNLHVTAVTSNNKITPLYQVREGSCDKSYGIHCARMLDFPEDVIRWAQEYERELEYQQGGKFMTNFETSVKRKVVEEGDQIIKQTLEKLLKVNTENDDDLLGAVKNIKAELDSSNNLFIKGLLSQ